MRKLFSTMFLLSGFAFVISGFSSIGVAKEKSLQVFYSSAANGYVLPCG